MARCTARANRPFGVTLETTYRRPWESLQKYLQEVYYREYLFWLSIPVGWPKAETSNRRARKKGIKEVGRRAAYWSKRIKE
jgi:hypothetical protein